MSDFFTKISDIFKKITEFNDIFVKVTKLSELFKKVTKNLLKVRTHVLESECRDGSGENNNF